MATHVTDASARPQVPGRRPLSPLDRFERYCEALPNGCKRWHGGGTFSLSGGQEGHCRPQVAAYRLYHGLIKVPYGQQVLATCGYEACVEATHLAKRVGTRQPHAASAERTADILESVRRGETYEAIGARYLLSRQRIEQVVRGLMVKCPTCDGCGKVLPPAEAAR